MPHFNWTYVGEPGKKYHVGLFHGKRTGHVLIHCNAKIIVVDFNVLESRDYTFFIEDELCKISLEKREKNHFYYFFHIDRQTDTPLNRARQVMERKYWKQTLLFFGAIIGLALLLLVVGKRFLAPNLNQMDIPTLLSQLGGETIGKVRYDSLADPPILKYQYVADRRIYDGETEVTEEKKEMLFHRPPILPGDEYVVRYMNGSPSVSILMLENPTTLQIERYQKRVARHHLSIHPELFEKQALCLVRSAYELKGLEGLADFFYQKIPPGKNSYHNRDTYHRLTRDLPFQKKVEESCWE